LNLLGGIALAPLLPPWALLLLAAGFAVVLGMLARRDPRMAALRGLIALGFLAILSNPVVRHETRTSQRDVGLVLLDDTASMAVDGRGGTARNAVAALKAAAPGIEWRVRRVPQRQGEPTRLGAASEAIASAVPSERLAGIVVISDGISADAPDPRSLPAGKPLHVLVAGDPGIVDRRLVVVSAPAYSVAGESARITVRIDDGPSITKRRAALTIARVGAAAVSREVETGAPVTLDIPVDRRGHIDVALSVAALTGERSLVNNRALVRLNGVTDRLRVLLVSGTPYPGGRYWRDVLKSDANIDLVHFTILRLPTSFDMTPPEELSLIPFPVEELFEEHLPDFDLIVFDRFSLSDLLSPIYFQDLADRVRAGGGLLVVTGEEFNQPGGLAGTDLAAILPARVAGPVIEQRFRPALTQIGRRHPVTAELVRIWGGTDWGRWGTLADLAATRGRTLMTGAGERPLLVLDRLGKGRVGLIASTSVWWWSRGVDGEGPEAELLRRVAHWLMREPDLEDEQLAVSNSGRTLAIAARGVTPATTATIAEPNGTRRTVALSEAGDGRRQARIEVAGDGLYRVSVGTTSRYVLAGNTAELADIRPRTAPLADVAAATGGGTWWLKDGLPRLRRVTPGSVAAGARWMGLVRNNAGTLIAVSSRPLLHPALALTLLAGALVLAWWRERR
jgi:hypothetical protein